MISAIPGASKYFLGGVVAYNAKVKIEELQVSKEVIKQHSVVSAKVAEAMALGIQKKYKANYAIATTGNAGPTTDKTNKSVGVVFIAVATLKGVFTEEFFFGQPREKVIERASNKALELLYKNILKN
jgi:nicotinamide-nucleotide amidase